MKLIEVELHHVAENNEGSITTAILSLTFDDQSHCEVEVDLSKIGPDGSPSNTDGS